MLALRCDEEPRLVTDLDEPVRKPGEALIRMRVAGVCDTDLQLARGYMGYSGVLGHEFVGEVVEADDPRWLGRRVVADINAGCGRCADCIHARGHHCRARTVLGIVGRDGAMAERFTIPESCLVAVPESVSDERAVFAEPLAAALHVLDDTPADADRIVVLGDGKLGQLIARALVPSGKRIVVVGHHEDKLANVRASGAEAILEKEIGRDFDDSPVVVDATGSSSGIALALRLTRPRGTVVLKTTIAGSTSIDLSPLVINELRVVGSRCGDLGRAIDALADGHVDPEPLIAARYPLTKADEALRHAARPGVLKVLVTTLVDVDQGR